MTIPPRRRRIFYDITVELTDDDTGETDGDADILIKNVDPVVGGLVLDSNFIKENGTVTLDGSFTDQGPRDTHDEVVIDWGDGVVDNIPLNGASIFTANHQYVDDDPTNTPDDDYTITVKVKDDDTGVGTETAIVNVDNEPPLIEDMFLDPPTASYFIDEVVTVKGEFSDIGKFDTHKGIINWGDGSTSIASVDQFLRTFSGTHIYKTEGEYQITVTIEDDDTDEDSQALTVLVRDCFEVTNENDSGPGSLRQRSKTPTTTPIPVGVAIRSASRFPARVPSN